MSAELSKERLMERDTASLTNLMSFHELLVTIAYLPGNTQESLDKNLTTLRSVFKEKMIDGCFMELFHRSSEVIRHDAEFESSGLVLNTPYTYEDFINTEDPYKEIAEERTAFRREQVATRIAKQAAAVGVKNFKKLLSNYDRGMEEQVIDRRTITFPICKGGERMSLDPGDWHISAEDGIWREHGENKEFACTHPIAPVQRLINIDTGEHKLVIAFERNGQFHYIMRSKLDLFDSKKVISLASVGVAVTSKSAPVLSDFLNDIETRNYDEIPEKKCVTRLGFVGDGMFSPYVEDLIFDGEAEYGTIFRSITQKGDYDKWLECARKCRGDNLTAHIMLAASFASVLISKIGGLPFFVHLWGGSSGTGKTVALMLAASVWGDPEVGKYIQTFNATQVGHEKVAALLNNIPMLIDELQLAKDSHGHQKFNPYQLAQGVGRTRGNKAGGIDRTPTWSLCILSTGESQIVGENAGSGAVNRVIDIECKPGESVVKDGFSVCKVINSNYGYAGRVFVEALTDDKITGAVETYEKYFKDLSEGETTEKQAMAAAMILVADQLADEIVFKTGSTLTESDIAKFLQSKESVSVGKRGYDYLCDWVTINSAKFKDDVNERYGKIEGDYAYIIRTIYNREMDNAGFDGKAVLSWMQSENLLQTDSDGKHIAKKARVGEILTRCIVVKIEGLYEFTDEELDDAEIIL